MIKVENVTKMFGSSKAVDDISFEIKKGEIVGFLGPNGAGKSTTMRIITGFIAPDRGKVYINGMLVDENSKEAQKQIGYLPENNPLYKDMLVSEFLDLAADLSNIPKEKRSEAFDFAVAAVGIKDVFHKPISELSKGYRQRVGIASAILHKPETIIMDEPTEGLDPNQRAEIRTLIKKLAEKHTIIISTHVMQEASAVCNRLLVINKGKIVADGTVDDLMKKASQTSVVSVDIEGSNVEALLQGIDGAEKVEIEKKQGERIAAKIFARESRKIQPEISKIARGQNWVIWKISEDVGLEDVFYKLTR